MIQNIRIVSTELIHFQRIHRIIIVIPFVINRKHYDLRVVLSKIDRLIIWSIPKYQNIFKDEAPGYYAIPAHSI